MGSQHEYQEHLGGSHESSVCPSMKMKDSFKGFGRVLVRQFRMVDGEKVFLPDPPFRSNLIVEAGRASLIDLLIGSIDAKLTYIRWGQGGAAAFPEGDPLDPFVVQDGDVDVATKLLDKTLNTPVRKGPTEIEYTETLICDEVNTDVNEAAMLFEHANTGDRTIFARITFPTTRLTIDKGTGIELTWTFNFANVQEES